MAIEDYWELALLGLDGLVAYGFYKAYKHFSTDADVIEELPLYNVGPELYSYVNKLPNKCLPYVGICGLSKMSTDAHFQTSNFPSVGLIHEASKIEHKLVRIQGFWHEVTKKISSVVRSCKFGISAPDSFTFEYDPSFVEVRDPLYAEYLLSNLPIIIDDFEPTPSNFFTRSLDVLSGEIIRGYQYKETTLPERVELFGVGKVFMTSGKPQLCFGPPDLINNRYILTTLTKPQVVDSLRNDAKLSKYMYYMFLFTGTALAVWLVYKYFSRNPWIFARAREVVGTPEKVDIGVNPSLSMSSPSNQINDNACNVCLTSQRNILLMPCRHLTVCSGCYDNLPTPKKCPMCRTLVKECLPIYMT